MCIVSQTGTSSDLIDYNGAKSNRSGLFRTPISGGVQSATSSHNLPAPAVVVRNLIEQVHRTSMNCFGSSFWFNMKHKSCNRQ